jgi:hypothetical protein
VGRFFWQRLSHAIRGKTRKDPIAVVTRDEKSNPLQLENVNYQGAVSHVKLMLQSHVTRVVK